MGRDLFEMICTERRVFAKIRDVVCLFGIRKSDVYAQPPAPYFNLFHDSKGIDSDPSLCGFGNV